MNKLLFNILNISNLIISVISQQNLGFLNVRDYNSKLVTYQERQLECFKNYDGTENINRGVNYFIFDNINKNCTLEELIFRIVELKPNKDEHTVAQFYYNYNELYYFIKLILITNMRFSTKQKHSYSNITF